jgi:hypothetical protein
MSHKALASLHAVNSANLAGIGNTETCHGFIGLPLQIIFTHQSNIFKCQITTLQGIHNADSDFLVFVNAISSSFLEMESSPSRWRLRLLGPKVAWSKIQEWFPRMTSSWPVQDDGCRWLRLPDSRLGAPILFSSCSFNNLLLQQGELTTWCWV